MYEESRRRAHPERRQCCELSRPFATTEGFAVDRNKSDAIIGMELTNLRLYLERDGALTVLLAPDGVAAAQSKPAPVAA